MFIRRVGWSSGQSGWSSGSSVWSVHHDDYENNQDSHMDGKDGHQHWLVKIIIMMSKMVIRMICIYLSSWVTILLVPWDMGKNN